EPGAGLLDDTGGNAHIDEFTGFGDTFTVHNVEFDLTEGRGHLVFDDFDAGLVAHDFLTLLDRADAADIKTYRSIELERVTARGRFGVTEHDADLHAQLVDEDDDGI